MKKVFYVLSAVIVSIALYLILRPKPVTVETIEMHPGIFDETLTVDGKIRSREKYIIYSPASGNIESLQLKLGDPVKKGQTITKLEWDKVFLLKSPFDGVVSKLFRESAGPVARGEPIIEISNIDKLEVVVDILTPDAIRLSPKGQAKILNWGGENEIPAEIFQISRAGAVKTSALGVEEERTEVTLSFKKIIPELKSRFGDNYHVDVVFLISHESKVLTVPLGALFKSKYNWAVYVVQAGRAQLREIEITRKNDQQALVTHGLTEGDRVILFPGDKIHEGIKVQFVSP